MPPACAVTGERTAASDRLSPQGWTALHFIEAPFCPHCGVPFAVHYGDDVLCPSCIAAPPIYDCARAALSYNEAARKLVSNLKFKDQIEQTNLLAKFMVTAGADLLTDDCLLAPVPLHWRRLWSRRFNQSALLARSVGKVAGADICLDLLSRVRATPPQKDQISASARRRNVAGAFVVRPKYRHRIGGAKIVLVDDVLTSGATVSACARRLKKEGAARVDVLVLARVVKGGVGAI